MKILHGLYRNKDELRTALRRDKKSLKDFESAYNKLKRGQKVQNLTKAGARDTISGLKVVIRRKQEHLKRWK